jgi:hypothetical protein
VVISRLASLDYGHAAFEVLDELGDLHGAGVWEAKHLASSVADGEVKGLGGRVKCAAHRDPVPHQPFPPRSVLAHAGILADYPPKSPLGGIMPRLRQLAN